MKEILSNLFYLETFFYEIYEEFFNYKGSEIWNNFLNYVSTFFFAFISFLFRWYGGKSWISWFRNFKKRTYRIDNEKWL